MKSREYPGLGLDMRETFFQGAMLSIDQTKEWDNFKNTQKGEAVKEIGSQCLSSSAAKPRFGYLQLCICLLISLTLTSPSYSGYVLFTFIGCTHYLAVSTNWKIR
jgi:hypothetical protein